MDELQSLMTSVRASAQLHRYLHPPRTQTHVDLGSLVANVAAAIEDVTGLLCDVDAEAVTVPSPIAVHLAAAVNELAWNAYKHAYRGAEGGKIRIVCRRDDVDVCGCPLPIMGAGCRPTSTRV